MDRVGVLDDAARRIDFGEEAPPRCVGRNQRERKNHAEGNVTRPDAAPFRAGRERAVVADELLELLERESVNRVLEALRRCELGISAEVEVPGPESAPVGGARPCVLGRDRHGALVDPVAIAILQLEQGARMERAGVPGQRRRIAAQVDGAEPAAHDSRA